MKNQKSSVYEVGHLGKRPVMSSLSAIRPPVAFRLPASAMKVELSHDDDHWLLTYLGLTSIGLDPVGDALLGFERELTDETVANHIELRLRAAGRNPVRTTCDVRPTVVAVWKI
jgi:hypothetical protein